MCQFPMFEVLTPFQNEKINTGWPDVSAQGKRNDYDGREVIVNVVTFLL